MSTLALKIDVDTLHGTREGVPRLLGALERAGVNATFLFSLGPDHTGRAIRRMFRPGFLGKVRRTSVVSNYGLRTLLYGTLLPGPRIAERCRDLLREVAQRGFEVGVHAWDHVGWQDGVSGASEAWTRRELERACSVFEETFHQPPRIHGAAGWQLNRFVPRLERELGFSCASDVRGTTPFIPVSAPAASMQGVVQLPTTLPTLDELIGLPGPDGVDPVTTILARSQGAADAVQVFTLHAELEGGAYLADFERLLQGWKARGVRLVSLGEALRGLDAERLPRLSIASGTVPGRSGTLAVQPESA